MSSIVRYASYLIGVTILLTISSAVLPRLIEQIALIENNSIEEYKFVSILFYVIILTILFGLIAFVETRQDN